ncbi:hypothetical protein [Lacticaseibacillus mingshuiensis]|uniref:hypothetical protein n=1 Tax=Lacticaseibacillus mingshuiensis TaxID=2799574 RepID=UPI001950D9C8|nr:hypothetical protein [Lacticaseibacillus mingshuiensis]
MSKYWVQDSVEIENPYRHRGYFVGKEPIFNVQNDAYGYVGHGKVVKIEERSIGDMEAVGSVSSITFEDGAVTEVQSGPGYITSGHWEDEDDARD